MKITTPYADLLRPLSKDEAEALAASIKADGVQVPILIDEAGAILDGHNRYYFHKKYRKGEEPPTKVRRGLSDNEKVATVYGENWKRRHLTAEQKGLMLRAMKAVALKLNKEEGYTQAAIGALLGVSQPTVAAWVGTSIISPDNVCKPRDHRVKVKPDEKAEIVELVLAGESQSQVAADHDITQQRVAQIVKAAEKERQKQEEKRTVSAALPEIKDLWLGDFRELSEKIPSGTVDMVLTDPPYDDDSLPLYEDTARVAARILRPGGLCVVYAGLYRLPEILEMMRKHLSYMWVFALTYSGRTDIFKKYNVNQCWKALIVLYKAPLNATWNVSYAPDVVVGGGMEKDLFGWQQAESEASKLIADLVPAGGIVVDPMMGVGTVPAAAKGQGRRFIGIEIDKERYNAARARIGKD